MKKKKTFPNIYHSSSLETLWKLKAVHKSNNFPENYMFNSYKTNDFFWVLLKFVITETEATTKNDLDIPCKLKLGGPRALLYG